MKFFALLMTFIFIAASPAYAQIETYKFEKPHSSVTFTVSHLGFSHSQGKFLDFDGSIEFNRAEPAKSKTEVTIQTASINMDDAKWDEHLKNADFFNVEKFPTMTFKSTAIEVTGEKTAKITGDLTILETTKPVVLDVIFNKADKHPMKDVYMAGFSADTTIKRSEFGMNYGLPMVGDDVAIHIEVEAERQGEPTTNP